MVSRRIDGHLELYKEYKRYIDTPKGTPQVYNNLTSNYPHPPPPLSINDCSLYYAFWLEKDV